MEDPHRHGLNLADNAKRRRGPYQSRVGAEDTILSDDDCQSDISFNDQEAILSDLDSDVEEEVEECGDKNEEAAEDRSIYDGTDLKLSVAMLLIISFVTRFHLHGECLNELLGLLAILLPKPNILSNSLFKFRKYFASYKNPVITHMFCKKCYTMVNDEQVCPNAMCNSNLSETTKAYFLEFPIVPQIINFFKRDNFSDKIQHRFKRSKKNRANIEDIYDGEQYSNLCKKGLLSNKYNLSLIWNTDGCPVFKSSKFSIWPLYFVVNELPYYDRIKRDNMVFGGIWFGDLKPIMMCYLNPCFQSLKKLEIDGVDVNVFGHGVTNCKVFLVGGTADLPAKALVLNSMQYNASYGCHKCEQRGESLHTSARGTVHVYPFSVCDPKGPERTHDQTKHYAKSASAECPIKGVKGPNWFSFLNCYDQIKGCGIDYMHGICLGVVKLLTKLWFDSEHSGCKFSIRARRQEVDSRLSSIHPTREINRIPRMVSTHLKFWKAAEFRTFLLFYSLPVLFGILPQEFLQHFALLSQSIFILLQDSISFQELNRAESMLMSFVQDFVHLYGSRYMGINIHNLVHLTDSVYQLGPLWTHSCFHFEDKNGFILNLIHGTQSIPNQILASVNIIQSIPLIRQKSVVAGSAEHKYLVKLNRENVLNRKQQINTDTWIVGNFISKKLSYEDKLLLSLHDITHNGKWQCFARICKYITGRPVIIHSNVYLRASKRNDKTIVFKDGNAISYGIIEYFVKVVRDCQCILPCDCDNLEYLAVVSIIHVEQMQTDSHLLGATMTPRKQVINIVSIIAKCMFIEIEHSIYVAGFPNFCEKE